MTIREHIQAVRSKVRDVRVEDGLIGGDDRITVLLDAALAACDEREREFERAREAWRKRDERAFTLFWSADYAILDAYFNPAKEG